MGDENYEGVKEKQDDLRNVINASRDKRKRKNSRSRSSSGSGGSDGENEEDIDSDEGKEGEELETVAIVEAQAIHNLQV
eukprot:CAMPEP_0204843186 /NCGR_PEP_ID=MMETSP1346-20131115/47832_1 /ASSEMBLY_ACC=CAM_ASM_000771 /TAXON_ID=215587 /ORGANISM="Aplanochytrium stocchinoi, Strain GSBS06" /LENGTH=78 /DNA_ID=CAMNT_0051982287 /DNA_START=22 /DNA_END=259 /DNA_ORIENTATION=+